MKKGGNPSEWVLDTITEDKTDWNALRNKSVERRVVGAGFPRLLHPVSDEHARNYENRAAPSTQVKECIKQQFWRYWRLP